ncbi:hypothetical protein OUZ56_030924 [Daphnia magna]|uniref:Uncharacterized protein n=1 Tax=Daphnia magna TaxID=35525 RepID=A0ABQ9ZSW7_9CRUS|nr:hypothetical protein OUZ56_030924 [Daphnia magna]
MVALRIGDADAAALLSGARLLCDVVTLPVTVPHPNNLAVVSFKFNEVQVQPGLTEEFKKAYFISYHDAVSTPQGRGTSDFTTSFPKAESMMESL